MLATIDGFITDAVITSANVDERADAWDLASSYNNFTMFGDKGYIGDGFAAALKAEKDIYILPIKRSSSKVQFPKELRQTIFRLRRRIETSAPQLVCQLNIERVLAKSFRWLQTRIKAKLLAYNLCYCINKFIGRDSYPRIKELVFR